MCEIHDYGRSKISDITPSFQDEEVSRIHVVVIDETREELECIKEGDIELYHDMITILSDKDIVEEYFVNVSDETWNTFKDTYARRVFVNESELEKYLKTATYVFVHKNGIVKLCLPI